MLVAVLVYRKCNKRAIKHGLWLAPLSSLVLCVRIGARVVSNSATQAKQAFIRRLKTGQHRHTDTHDASGLIAAAPEGKQLFSSIRWWVMAPSRKA